jgi:ribosomal protein S6
MKHRYEALLVLNTQGREDTVKEVVDRLESEFQQEGAQIEQVQKMDSVRFPTQPARSAADFTLTLFSALSRS